jgi:hypothetical protein
LPAIVSNTAKKLLIAPTSPALTKQNITPHHRIRLQTTR